MAPVASLLLGLRQLQLLQGTRRGPRLQKGFAPQEAQPPVVHLPPRIQRVEEGQGLHQTALLADRDPETVGKLTRHPVVPLPLGRQRRDAHGSQEDEAFVRSAVYAEHNRVEIGKSPRLISRLHAFHRHV